jgi:hypothetical protein
MFITQISSTIKLLNHFVLITSASFFICIKCSLVPQLRIANCNEHIFKLCWTISEDFQSEWS